MSKYDVGFRRDANGEWQIIDDENEMTHVEMVQARLKLREALGLPYIGETSVSMDYVRASLDYEYDASVEFDMPLDFYGDDVSAETNQEVGA